MSQEKREQRRFCRFNRGRSLSTGESDWSTLIISEIPDGGFCLSTFLIVSRSGRGEEVLLGRLNPEGPWGEIGALDAKRAEIHSRGWMLPSSHLIYGESPHDSAKRILGEQLGIQEITAHSSDPKIYSEVYTPKPIHGTELPPHWDTGFIFSIKLESEKDLHPPDKAWTELEFFDQERLRDIKFARSHDDILHFVGF